MGRDADERVSGQSRRRNTKLGVGGGWELYESARSDLAARRYADLARLSFSAGHQSFVVADATGASVRESSLQWQSRDLAECLLAPFDHRLGVSIALAEPTNVLAGDDGPRLLAPAKTAFPLTERGRRLAAHSICCSISLQRHCLYFAQCNAMFFSRCTAIFKFWRGIQHAAIFGF